MTDLDKQVIEAFEAELDKKIKNVSSSEEKESTHLAEVLRIDNDGTIWVHIYGGSMETPVRNSAVTVEVGDVVHVIIANGGVTISSNMTYPVTSQSYVDNAAGAVSQQLSKMEVGVYDRLVAQDAVIGTLTAGYANLNELVAGKASIEELEANYAHITEGVIDNAKIGYADVNDLNAHYAQIDLANIENGTIKTAMIDDAAITTAKIDNAAITTAKIDDAAITTAKIGAAQITTALIADEAVADSKIISVSANKLTAGTIDAGNINVVNLRTKNLIVDKVNGQPVLGGYDYIEPTTAGYSSKNPSTEGWYELSNGSFVASSDTEVDDSKAYYAVGTQTPVYDQNYIDGLEDNLNARIDSQIETFTVSAVPTLLNEPASGWQQADYADHVGDLCYVINAASQADGYCYRFAYDSSTQTYGWVLIKDNDVTAALQDIIDIKGWIGDGDVIESHTDVASWITNTDNELSSTKSSVSSLQTAMGTKVDTTTFNTLSQTVGENSSTINTMSTVLSNNGLTTTSNAMTKINQNSTDITLRATKTEVFGGLDAYTPVEWLQSNSDGASRINTGHVVASWPIRMRTVVMFPSLATSETEIWGNYAGGSSYARFVLGTRDNKWYVWRNGAAYGSAVTTNTKYDVSIEYDSTTTATLIVNGVRSTYTVGSDPGVSASATNTVGLFSGRGDAAYLGYKSARIYQAQYFEKDILLYDFVPVKRKSDSVYGMLDMVNRVFYPSQGSAFTAGNEKTWLEMTSSELTVANGSISTKVEKNGVISSINQSPESVTINADRVNIEGAAIFTSGRLSSNSLNNAYDSNGAATSALNSAKSYADDKVAAVKVGARNLVLFTGDNMKIASSNTITDKSGIGGWGGQYPALSTDGVKLASITSSDQCFAFPLANNGSIANDEVFTLSFEARGTMQGTWDLYFIQASGSNVAKNCSVTQNKLSDSSWTKFSWTTSLPNANVRTCTKILVFYACSDRTGKWVEIKKNSLKLERGDKATDWSPAPEEVTSSIATAQSTANGANSREQIIYISKASGTTSVSANTTWVSAPSDASADGPQNAWTTKRPKYNSSYPVLFTAKQSQTVAQQAAGSTCSCTTPLKDDTTTVIDGGHITTGTIDASVVTVDKISASNIKSGTLSADRIAGGSLTIGKLSDLVVSGRNLVLGGEPTYSNAGYGLRQYYISDSAQFVAGEKYTISFEGTLASGKTNWYTNVYQPEVSYPVLTQNTFVLKNGRWQSTFTMPNLNGTAFTKVGLYNYPLGTPTSNNTVSKFKIERGTVATGWSPSENEYITHVDDNGITIHPSSTTSNRVAIDATGMDVINGDVSVAKYGSTARIGKEGSGNYNVFIDSNGVAIRANTTSRVRMASYTATDYEGGHAVFGTGTGATNLYGVTLSSGTQEGGLEVGDSSLTSAQGAHLELRARAASKYSGMDLYGNGSVMLTGTSLQFLNTVSSTTSNISLEGHTHSYAGASSAGGSANSAITMVAQDTRSDNNSPSLYFTNYGRRGVLEFKQRATIGAPGSDTYVHCLTLNTWSNASGGYPVQIAAGNTGDLYWRVGTSGTAWGSWNTASKNGHTHSYLPTSGGTISGNILVNAVNGTFVEGIRLNRAPSGWVGVIIGDSNGVTSGAHDYMWWVGVGPTGSYGRRLYVNHNGAGSGTYFYADSSANTVGLNLNGALDVAGTIKQNGTAVSLSGHTHSYVPIHTNLGPTTATNGTVTLSSSAANYNHMRIYFNIAGSNLGTDNYGMGSVDVYAPNGKYVVLSITRRTEDSTWTNQLVRATVLVSGTSITKRNYGYVNFSTTSADSNITSNTLYIYRVEAWNE